MVNAAHAEPLMINAYALILVGLLLWAVAGLIISNENNARRSFPRPTIVLANIFGATVNIFCGMVVIGVGFALLLHS